MHLVFRMILGLFCFVNGYASSISTPQSTIYQVYWNPMFHGERLNYCNEDKSCCGRKIASQYCVMMGFNDVSRYQKAPNLGFTRYISGKNECQGWMCSGFDFIECTGERRYSARPLSDFREELFVRPRWKKFPLAWCFDSQAKKCGRRAAYAFCRWQGYGKLIRYSNQKEVPASRKIGTNELCINKNCISFEYIVCKRA